MKQYFIFLYLIVISQILLYFLHSTLVLSFYIDVVFTLFINHPEYVALSIPISVFIYRCVVQQRRNSIANGLKLRLSCTNPSMYYMRCIGKEMNSNEIKYFTYAKIITLIYPESGICVVYTNSKLSIGPFGTNFSEIWIEFLIFSFKKMCLRNGGHFVQEESLDKTVQEETGKSPGRGSLEVGVFLIVLLWCSQSGIILGMGLANERRCYIVMPPQIGWAHIQNDPDIIIINTWRIPKRYSECLRKVQMYIVWEKESSVTGLTTLDGNHSVNWVQTTSIVMQIDSSFIGFSEWDIKRLVWCR